MEDVVEDIGPKDEDEEGHLQHPPSLEGPHGHAHTTRGLPIKKYPCVTLQVKSQWEGFPSGFTTDQVFTVQIYVKKWQIPGLCHTVYKVSVMYTKLPRKEGELFSWALPQKCGGYIIHNTGIVIHAVNVFVNIMMQVVLIYVANA